jgi:hypothetical protein
MIQKIVKNLFLATLFTATTHAQESNILTYTPSKLLHKSQVDVKWFNNFYTQTEDPWRGEHPRENYFTTTFETFYGVSENSRFNVGLVFNVKSNNIGGKSWFSPLNFENKEGISRAAFTSIAPIISFQPIKNVGNFSIRTGVFIPLVDYEKENGVYLDKKSYVWETKFFYDYTFPSGKWQLFTELDTQFNFGEEYIEDNNTSEGGFANNSLGVPVSAFVSYFPTHKSTVYLLTQQYVLIDLGNKFSQEYTQLGFGGKYQVTRVLNVEASYTNFVRGSDTGFGETLNLGLRFISN